MFFYSSNWILAGVCMFIFFGAGRAEAKGGGRDNAFLWAALSLAVSAVAIQAFGAGWMMVVLCQILLFIGIGVFRAMRDKK